MNTSLASNVSVVRGSRARLFRGLAVLVSISALAALLPAQTATTPAAGGVAPAADTTSTNANGRVRRNGGGGGGGGNFNPADIQARMMTNLREQFAVKDDAEWSLIAERITAVMDLRRSLATGGFGGFGGRGGANADTAGGGNNNRPNRGGNAAANPELTALRSALSDNLPDAEIKARLDRLREVRKQNETKLTKAQEELRAVLTVRQEAVGVMAGLLP